MSDNPIPAYDGGTGVNNGNNTLTWTGGNVDLACSGNVTMNLPNGSLTLPTGTIPSSTGVGATGTWPISITGTSSGAPPTGSASGDLSGSYPSPTVNKINGVSLGSTSATSGNILIGSGTSWVSNSVQGDVTLDLAGNVSIDNGAITNAKIANATIDLGTKVTNVLQSGNGGTNTSFVAFTGPTTSVKTFTLPNADSTVLTTNAAVTAVQGGTGQTSYTLGDTLYSSASNTLSKLSGNITTGKQYLSQTGTGTVSAAPVWATISGSDITGSALTVANDTNVTLTLGGTPATALLKASSITAGWSGTLGASRGGTNVDSSAWSQGDLVYISATGTWNHLAKSTTSTRYLANTGTTNNPNWDQINLANGITGTLSVANGGTGQTSYTNGQILIGNTTGNTLTLGTIAGTTNQVVVTNGAGTITLSLPQSIATSSSPTFTGLNLSGLTASGLVATDASKNLTSTISGLSPAMTGLNLSGLTASNLVATDGSKNLTSSVSGLSPTFTGLTLSGLSSTGGILVTNGSKALQTIASTSTYTPTIGDGTNNFTTSTAVGNYMIIGNLVWVTIRIVWTGKGSAVAGSTLSVSLPLTIGASTPRANASLGLQTGIGFTGSYLTWSASSGSSILTATGFSTTGTGTTVIISQVATTGEFDATLLYTSN